MSRLKVGTIFRYSRPYSVDPPIIDGLPNLFAYTQSPGATLTLLDSGVSPIQKVVGTDGVRIPAILIASSPHKIGSEDTPWEDIFDSDNGKIRFFGDNRISRPPEEAAGNKALLEQFRFHSSPDKNMRKMSSPIFFFERTTVAGRKKGNVKFHGFGVIQNATLVTQYQAKIGYFTNYVFDFVVLSLTAEMEELDWKWISARRDPTSTLAITSMLAPSSWKKWMANGPRVLDLNRRRVATFQVVHDALQRPVKGSREDRCLTQIYDHYAKSKRHNFELLASRVVHGIITRNGGQYQEGWITVASGDGGVDFIGRIDEGSGFASLKIIVLGQAKCQTLDKPTSGRDLARTVARLKRGWVGAYVTTSYFSEKAQVEIYEDQYPLITVNGKELATETLRLQMEGGFRTLESYLEDLDRQYPSRIRAGRPEEILWV